MKASFLSHEQARRVYDRIGRWQDTQAFYEHRPTSELITLARLEQAHAVLEFGCGTGSFARRMLAHNLPGAARYLGIDVSPVMVALAAERLRPWSPRAEVRRSDGSARLPVGSAEFDRVVATYVLDLLDPADTHQLLAEARRVLTPGGLLCVASLSADATGLAALVTRGWRWVWSRSPRLVGGCRPIRLTDRLAPDEWVVLDRRVVTAFAVPSELVVARPTA